jgi:hypothetical protein
MQNTIAAAAVKPEGVFSRTKSSIWGLLRGEGDPDDVFSYTTLKEVVIRDRRLGLLDRLFKLGILFGYIFMYQIVYQKNFLECYAPTAQISAEISYLLAPSDNQCALVNQTRLTGDAIGDNYLDIAGDTSYCNATYKDLTTECKYEPISVVNQGTGSNYLKVATLVKTEIDNGDTGTPNDLSYAFVRGHDGVMVQIFYDAQTPPYLDGDEKMGGDEAQSSSFTLVNTDGEVVEKCSKAKQYKQYSVFDTCGGSSPFIEPCIFNAQEDEHIVMPMAALYDAAGLDLNKLLDSTSEEVSIQSNLELCITSIIGGVISPTFKLAQIAGLGDPPANTFQSFDEMRQAAMATCEHRSLRMYGAKLMATLEFDNMRGSRGSWSSTFAPSRPTVIMSVRSANARGPLAVTETESSGTVTTKTTYGAYITFTAAGELCKSDFSVLLMTLTTALGLLATSTVMTEFVMLTVLPERDLYEEAKTEYTSDFSDIRAQKALSGDTEESRIDRLGSMLGDALDRGVAVPAPANTNAVHPASPVQ